HRAIRRPAAKCSIGGLFALLHSSCRRGGGKAPECDHAAGRTGRRQVMTAYAARFPILSRLLHWLMAAMILAMLFIGIGMVATVSKRYELLVSIHRTLGIAILILVVVRLASKSLPQSAASAARHGPARPAL